MAKHAQTASPVAFTAFMVVMIAPAPTTPPLNALHFVNIVASVNFGFLVFALRNVQRMLPFVWVSGLSPPLLCRPVMLARQLRRKKNESTALAVTHQRKSNKRKKEGKNEDRHFYN